MRRRSFFTLAAGTIACRASAADPLHREVGVTTGSFMRHITAGEFRIIDLPKIMRDELGMKVIDLMTATLESVEPRYLERLRKSSADHGCVITNLKMNQKGIDMCSADAAERKRALDEYKRTIDAAALLGARWVRPLPGNARPDLALVAAGYRELIDYAAPKGIGLLVENFGWMQGDAAAIPDIIARVGPELRAQPDTGNWTSDEVRYSGLAKAFPLAVSCDFKAFEFDAEGKHPRYDLKRCFQKGWDAGFRGPWCIEHFAKDLKQLLGEMVMIRDWLKAWMRP